MGTVWEVVFSVRGWEVTVARTLSEGLAALDPPPDYLILDLKLPDGGGEAILHKVRDAKLKTRVAVTTGSDDPRQLSEVKGLEPEAFDALLTRSDYVDLSFHLDPGSDRVSRLAQVQSVLRNAKIMTLFDLERLPPERRGSAWNKRVEEMSRRLGFDTLRKFMLRREVSPLRQTLVARRLRTRLKEYITVAHGAGHLRDEITPFMLGRIEAAIAAAMRLFGIWP